MLLARQTRTLAGKVRDPQKAAALHVLARLYDKQAAELA